MKLFGSLSRALHQLETRDKAILLGLAATQFGLALMDLIGVLMLGALAALAASAELPEPLARTLSAVGLEDLDRPQLLAIIGSSAAILLVLKSVLSFLLIRRILRFLASRQVLVSHRIASALFRRPILEVNKRASQETAYGLVGGVSALTLGLIGNAVIILAELILITIIVLGLAVVDFWVTAFTVLFFAAIAIALQLLLARRTSRLGLQLSRADIASHVKVQEMVKMYREISVAGRQELYVKALDQSRSRAASVQADLQLINQTSKYVFEVGIVVGGCLLVASQVLLRDTATAIATSVLFLVAATRLMPSLLRMQASLMAMRSSTGLAAVTLDLCSDLGLQGSSVNEVGCESTVSSLQRPVREVLAGDELEFDVTLKSVSFRYPAAAENAVDGVNLAIKPGTATAIVGTSGAGKSTLADLMLGLLQPTAGSVLVGGEPPRESAQKFPGGLAYVPQNVFIFDGSISENVTFGLPPECVDDALVWKALETVRLDEHVRETPGQLSSLVGEGGTKLSGGQRQRLGLARALYASPRLLVLDEATSALDFETEAAVTEALQALVGELTLVVIAHRLRTVLASDQIVYMQSGAVVVSGSLEEVRSSIPSFDGQVRLL